MTAEQIIQKPDIKLSVKQTFGFDSNMKVEHFQKKTICSKNRRIIIDKDTTLSILAGFSFNKRVLIQGIMAREVYSYRASSC